MSRTIPLPFQVGHIDALIARLRSLRYEYARLGAAPDPRVLKELREQSACVMLQAPTGIGKTLIAAEVLARFSAEEPLLWFWFAPFAGLVDQAASVLKQQAPTLTQLDVIAHRQIDRLEPGSTFVLTWQTVAARSSASRLARQATETGLSIDDLIVAAREQGLRVGVVVDEAHHGFVRAQEACRYKLGNPDEWASIPRSEGVSAQLLKRSVKAARFIAKSEDEAQLLSFEEVALSECAAMHRRLQKLMRDAGLGATPLMLVQVPNGGDALKRAREHLVGALRFDPQAVRVHTADEPDPNLRAMANDPKVEVILFKMAIATGFDAPRAATLAALRGTRDVNFGIQVVGRILRVHREMQGKLHQLPAELSFGYVFLANSEAQEGLLGAAAELNQMPGHLIGSMASSVVTIYADQVLVQRVGLGESLELVPDADLPHVLSVDEVAEAHRASQRLSIPTGAQPVPGGNPPAGGILGGTGHVPSVGDLFPDLPATPTDTPLARVLSLESRRGPREYRKRPGTPAVEITQSAAAMRALPADGAHDRRLRWGRVGGSRDLGPGVSGGYRDAGQPAGVRIRWSGPPDDAPGPQGALPSRAAGGGPRGPRGR